MTCRCDRADVMTDGVVFLSKAANRPHWNCVVFADFQECERMGVENLEPHTHLSTEF